MRASGLMGRAFALRDRGELDEALEVCLQAMRTAGRVDPDAAIFASFGTLVSCAQTIDQIARKLGRPEVAREPLETALQLLESANRTGRPSDELIQVERDVRARLDQLRSAR